MNALTVVIHFWMVLSCLGQDGENGDTWTRFHIDKNVFTIVRYGQFDVKVYQHEGTLMGRNENRYWFPPTSILQPDSSVCILNKSTRTMELRFVVEMWNEELVRKITEYLEEVEGIRKPQVGVIPFERVLLKTTTPTNFYQTGNVWLPFNGQHHFTFRLAFVSKEKCDEIGDHMRTNPEDFFHFRLLFNTETVNTRRRTVLIKVDSIRSGRLYSQLKDTFSAARNVLVTSEDAERLFSESVAEVVSETFDDLEMPDPSSEAKIHDVVKELLVEAKVVVRDQNSPLWSSVYFDPQSSRPDRVSRTVNAIYQQSDEMAKGMLRSLYSKSRKNGVDLALELVKYRLVKMDPGTDSSLGMPSSGREEETPSISELREGEVYGLSNWTKLSRNRERIEEEIQLWHRTLKTEVSDDLLAAKLAQASADSEVESGRMVDIFKHLLQWNCLEWQGKRFEPRATTLTRINLSPTGKFATREIKVTYTKATYAAGINVPYGGLLTKAADPLASMQMQQREAAKQIDRLTEGIENLKRLGLNGTKRMKALDDQDVAIERQLAALKDNFSRLNLEFQDFKRTSNEHIGDLESKCHRLEKTLNDKMKVVGLLNSMLEAEVKAVKIREKSLKIELERLTSRSLNQSTALGRLADEVSHLQGLDRKANLTVMEHQLAALGQKSDVLLWRHRELEVKLSDVHSDVKRAHSIGSSMATVVPQLVRQLLKTQFENGTMRPWSDLSPEGSAWIIETLTNVPESVSGTRYLRSNCQKGRAVLGSPVFTALPGDVIEFSYWFQSGEPDTCNLDLYLTERNANILLLGLLPSFVINEWNKASVTLPVNSSVDVSLAFNVEGEGCSIGLDDILLLDGPKPSSWLPRDANCGGVLYGQGNIKSPNYPFDYGSNSSCYWYLESDDPQHRRISLQFHSFSTEYYNDVVSVYEGWSPLGRPLLNHFYGTQGPFVVETDRVHRLLVRFESNGAWTDRGFRAFFSSRLSMENATESGPNYVCGEPATADAGVVVSPNYPSNYPDKFTCETKIRVSSGQIRLKFTHFLTERQYDYVTVYDGTPILSPRLLRICGSDNLPIVFSSGTELVIRFTTDGSTNYKGWRASYSRI